MMFCDIMKCMCGACCAVVVMCVEVRGMSEFVLDASIDAKSLYLGLYNNDLTSKALSRSREIVRTIHYFDDSSPTKLRAFLLSANSSLDSLTDEQCCAFKIYLEQLAWAVPGESRMAEGNFRVIALANVLAGYSTSEEDFRKKRETGEF
jgi:hypothetical protein